MQIVNALFDDRHEAEQAFEALLANKFDRSDISLIAQGDDNSVSKLLAEDDKTNGVLKGAATGAGLGVAAGLALMIIPGIGPVTALGWFAATLGGGAAGGALGAFTGNMAEVMSKAGVDQKQADFYAEAVRRGGNLLVLRVKDGEANNARAVLNDFDRIDPQDRMAEYVQQGWKKFDSDDTPYTPDQIEAERLRYSGGVSNDNALGR